MHVVIVGCGRVGSTLGRQLVAQGNSVAVVDRKSEAFARLGSAYTGSTVLGIGFDRDVLIEAGIERAGAVAAVTNGDNSNILIARVARENFGIERVVARIYDPKRAEIYERLGIATVATVRWTTEQVMRRIMTDRPAVEWTDPSTELSIVERLAPDTWVGERLSRLNSGLGLVVGLRRYGKGLLATDELLVQQGDVLYMAAPNVGIPALDAHLAAGPVGDS